MNASQFRKLITKAAGDRTVLIDLLLAELQKEVLNIQGKLLTRFVTDWVDSLDVNEDTGVIKNTLRNKRLLANVDTIFAQYVKTDGVVIAKTMLDGVQQILDFNGKYFKNFATHAELVPIQSQVKTLMESWLGLKGNGALEGNGYLAKTISDPRILGDLKDFALKAVVGQQGYKDTLKGVKTFIDGNKDTAGLLEKYHRNFVYDTYSQVDRATSGVFADKIGLDYAIYEGGLIKTSRKFCKEHNGKVYTREEIAAFLPTEGIPPNYNPFQDLGGYGCRHHLNWISYAIAVVFRPDLQK
jgi:hypothetical protein